jgi:hypothetical protein
LRNFIRSTESNRSGDAFSKISKFSREKDLDMSQELGNCWQFSTYDNVLKGTYPYNSPKGSVYKKSGKFNFRSDKFGKYFDSSNINK